MLDEKDLVTVERFFSECEFKSDGDDCGSCKCNDEGKRLWFQGIGDEGNYFCDECALDELKEHDIDG